ncbi:TIGR01459 family HAD-type hydrolase, partial [Mesorhizobium sp. M2D.F.Ca.ET.206.01.1.1]
MADSPDIVGSLEDVSKAYSAILCDVWGVVHNGEWHFPAAAAALAAARATGIPVVLITNSPRRSADVVAQMSVIGVPPSAYDRVVTSGDVT